MGNVSDCKSENIGSNPILACKLRLVKLFLDVKIFYFFLEVQKK